MKIKPILLLIFFSAACFQANCQEKVNVLIDPASSLNIHGKTNVNSFLCAQCETMDRDTLQVQLKQEGDVFLLDNAILMVRVNDFDCGIRQMTKEFRELLNAEAHPYLKMIINSVKPVNKGKDFMADISIILAGVKSNYRIPVQVHTDERTLICSGKSQVSFVDFNLEPPVKFLGMVKVNEMLDISFNLIIRKLI